MFEKVNPSHPDKVADRIAGAVVDLAYKKSEKPRIAVEVLIGHGSCYIIAESSVKLKRQDVASAVARIAGSMALVYKELPQDKELAKNQEEKTRCGDNGIFKGCPVSEEQRTLSRFMRNLYEEHPSDGKAVIDGGRLILCQSNAHWDGREAVIVGFDEATVNPLGDWTGGLDADTGATNRKLGSDIGDAVTGGGIHGKDLSKADVSVNVACHIIAQQEGQTVEACCAIGDECITFRYRDGRARKVPFADVVATAKAYIDGLGGFEKLAEWGLV